MTLTEATNIAAWTPLHTVATDPIEVLPSVFLIRDELYVHTQMYSAKFETGLSDAPFVTLLYWAPGLSAVKRLVNNDASITMARQAAPPSELVFGTSGTYGELAKKIPRTVSRVAETASYNNKGQFLYKEISIPPYTYFFSSVEIVPEEMTCLIKIRLKNT